MLESGRILCPRPGMCKEIGTNLWRLQAARHLLQPPECVVHTYKRKVHSGLLFLLPLSYCETDTDHLLWQYPGVEAACRVSMASV